MLEACALSDKGCVRTNNEDYSRIEPDMGLYVLADGMGGAKAGERASRLAVETVSESILTAHNRDSQALLVAVEEANRRVLEAAAHDPALEGMGTTLVVALEEARAFRRPSRLPRGGRPRLHRRPRRAALREPARRAAA